MTFLNNLINSIGKTYVLIIAGVLLLLIIGLILWRFLKIRKYRKLIVELENRMNATKTLPIQYRLGRVKGIARNMPDVKEKYEEYSKEYDELVEGKLNSITEDINTIDEKVFTRHLHGIKKQFDSLATKIADYENESKVLLAKIEVITDIENVQRVEIIKIKEKYRNTTDTFNSVRFKIEDFVPAIPKQFDKIDQEFVDLEELMNNQLFKEAKETAGSIEKEIDNLDNNLRDLPTYISVVRQYIPQRLEEINKAIASMKERKFALERMNTTVRVNKITEDLKTAIIQIKDLDIENVGANIEVITEEIKDLNADFEKEEVAYKAYNDKKNQCYNLVKSIKEGIVDTNNSLEELKKNYILDTYNITLVEDTKSFKDIEEEVDQLTVIINSRDFSYAAMIESFDDVIERCKPYSKTLDKYRELEESLRIEEKRALDELENINIVLLEIKSEIKNKHLPMISDSYKDYIEDSYQKADVILNFIKKRPIDLISLSSQVDAARDVIYKLYDNVHNLIVTAEMVEDAIIYGNRFRSDFVEVNTELTKAELLFRNGEYTKALTTAVDIIEKIKPGSYEMLVNSSKTDEAPVTTA